MHPLVIIIFPNFFTEAFFKTVCVCVSTNPTTQLYTQPSGTGYHVLGAGTMLRASPALPVSLLSYGLSDNVLMSSSFLKDSFARCGVLG